jgi:hypothetical protein
MAAPRAARGTTGDLPVIAADHAGLEQVSDDDPEATEINERIEVTTGPDVMNPAIEEGLETIRAFLMRRLTQHLTNTTNPISEPTSPSEMDDSGLRLPIWDESVP